MWILGKWFPGEGEPKEPPTPTKRTAQQQTPKTKYRKGYNVEVVRGGDYKEAMTELDTFIGKMQSLYDTFEVKDLTVSVFNYVDYTIVFKI